MGDVKVRELGRTGHRSHRVVTRSNPCAVFHSWLSGGFNLHPVPFQRYIFNKGDGVSPSFTSQRRLLVTSLPCIIFNKGNRNQFSDWWMVILGKWMCCHLFHCHLLFWCRLFYRVFTSSARQWITLSTGYSVAIFGRGIWFCAWWMTILCRSICSGLQIGLLL